MLLVTERRPAGVDDRNRVGRVSVPETRLRRHASS